MKTSFIRWTGTLIGLLLLLTQCSPPTDWSGWRGPNRDGVVTGFEAPAEWPGELSKVWQKKVGLGDASPILVDNQFYLYVLKDSSEVILCLDAETGDPVWQTTTNKAPEITGGARSHPGPRSTPTVANGKLFALGAGGIFSCLSTETGEIIWQNKAYQDIVPRFFTSASPLLVDDLCIIHLGDQEQGVIVAFNIQTGEEVWKHENEPCTYSSAVRMEDDMLVVQAENSLLGFSIDGENLWNIPTPIERRFYSSATPIVNGNQVIVTGQGNGTKMYQIEENEDQYSPKLIWSNEEYGVTFNTPVLKDGYLYGNEARFGSIFCLDASNGKTCWSDTTKLNRFGSMLDLGDVMLTLTANRTMVIFEPGSSGYVEKAKYIVAETDIYAHPLVAKNRFYIKDEESLICWALE